MTSLFIGPFQVVIILIVLAVVAGIVIASFAAPKQKPDISGEQTPQGNRKAASTKRWVFAILTVLTVVSFLLPWAEYAAFGFSGGNDGNFLDFVDGFDRYLKGDVSEYQIYTLMICTIAIFPLLLCTLIACIGGWKIFLRVTTRLTAICVCLITLTSINVGGDKLLGYYLTVLCGIVLLFQSFGVKLFKNAEPSKNNESSVMQPIT